VDERGAGVKHLTNIFRRLHRIFAHAWFQHRGVFWQVEGQTGLYVLFKTVCDTYDLLPAENYKLPPEAEGLEPVEEVRAPAPSIMKSTTPSNTLGAEEDLMSAGRTNTRRHIRQSPSVGSAVHTVLEADEEEADVTSKLKNMQIAEEEGEAEVPVIVESYEVDQSLDIEPPVPEPPAVDDGAIHIQEDSSNSSTSSWDRMSSDSVGNKADPGKKEDTVTEPKAETESVSLPLEEAEQRPESEDELEQLERFSPDLEPKEEPKPDTADIPKIDLAIAEEDSGKPEES
jgi:hypothetical protein